MASLNKATLIGNLGRDPETRFMPSGDAVATFSIATTEKWRDKQSNEIKEATEWHRIVFFGKLAEVAGHYLKKGSQVYVEGKIKTKKYTDKDGIEKFSTEITGEKLVMLGGRQDGAASSPSPSSAPTGNGDSYRAAKEGRAPMPERGSGTDPDMDDDIPF